MYFTSNYAKEKNLFLTFISNPDKDKVKLIDQDNKIIFLNPNYILNAFHVMMAVNQAFYYIKLGKAKSKEYKKEIIHCLTFESKLADSLKVHNIQNNEENNYYVIFIDLNKDEIKEKIKEISGTEITVDNYANFLNFENLINHFKISEELEINNIENGIQRAIYNRISTKDLK